MYPSDGIRSQLEWNSTLTTTDAPTANENNKHKRKVWVFSPSEHMLYITNGDHAIDCHYRYYRYVGTPVPWLVFSEQYHLHSGPKVNTVEKLGELRRAGVNIGTIMVLVRCSVTECS